MILIFTVRVIVGVVFHGNESVEMCGVGLDIYVMWRV